MELYLPLPERYKQVIDLYGQGVIYPEIIEKTGVARSTIPKIIERYAPDLPRRRPVSGKNPVVDTMLERVRKLALDGLTAQEIAEAIPAPLRSVSTYLSKLRREGKIGTYDGRSLPRDGAGYKGSPLPHMFLRLDYDTRDLLDGEAADRDDVPAELALRILRTVLSNQELVEAVLGEEA